MHRIFLRTGFAAIAALALVGCDQLSALGLGPQPAASAPPGGPPPVQVIADLRPHAGDLYPSFVTAEGARYSPEQLGFSVIDRTRFSRSMATPSVGQLMQGGGAEALVFTGCAAAGCNEGFAIVAIDTATGTVFSGVRDGDGADVLAPNDRVEALLRLNSPTRAWDNPGPTQTAYVETANP